MTAFRDRVGLGWRPKIAAGILSNLDRIDVVEVIADDFFDAPRRERRALRTLAAQTPIALHGVSLGLASSVAVDKKRLDKVARLCDEVAPVSWSEHLA
ncbi:MAG: multinuclear nonheme iron-dependent oxidase, partial [Gammaproteobacteria bacterium]